MRVGNKAFDHYFGSRGGFNSGLLMHGELFYLQLSYSGRYVPLARQ
jgi:hypothetical protein